MPDGGGGQIKANSLIEALKSQRNDALDRGALLAAQLIDQQQAFQFRIDQLQIEIDTLRAKLTESGRYEPAPTDDKNQ